MNKGSLNVSCTTNGRFRDLTSSKRKELWNYPVWTNKWKNDFFLIKTQDLNFKNSFLVSHVKYFPQIAFASAKCQFKDKQRLLLFSLHSWLYLATIIQTCNNVKLLFKKKKTCGFNFAVILKDIVCVGEGIPDILPSLGVGDCHKHTFKGLDSRLAVWTNLYL